MTALPDAAFLEDLTLTCWPALMTVHRDGWLIRLSGGHTGRSNSVNVTAPGREPTADKIAFAESVYAAHGLPPLFRVTPLSPPDMPALLERAGYHAFDTSSVQVLGTLPDDAADPAVTVERAPTTTFRDAYARIRSVPAHEIGPMRAILEAIPMPALYVSLAEGGRIVATAMTVVDRGWAGLFKVAVAPDSRGRGLGRRVTLAALAAAAPLGARGSYLQVASDNAPALALYAGLGFREVYTYTYFRKG